MVCVWVSVCTCVCTGLHALKQQTIFASSDPLALTAVNNLQKLKAYGLRGWFDLKAKDLSRILHVLIKHFRVSLSVLSSIYCRCWQITVGNSYLNMYRIKWPFCSHAIHFSAYLFVFSATQNSENIHQSFSFGFVFSGESTTSLWEQWSWQITW